MLISGSVYYFWLFPNLIIFSIIYSFLLLITLALFELVLIDSPSLSFSRNYFWVRLWWPHIILRARWCPQHLQISFYRYSNFIRLFGITLSYSNFLLWSYKFFLITSYTPILRWILCLLFYSIFSDIALVSSIKKDRISLEALNGIPRNFLRLPFQFTWNFFCNFSSYVLIIGAKYK